MNATSGSGRTVTLTVTNGTLNTASSGTFAASKSGIYNGQTIYFKINSNGGTSSTRTITLTPSAGVGAASSGNTYTATTWTQAADTSSSVGYQYAFNENGDLFELIDERGATSNDFETCETLDISPEGMLNGNIAHTVTIKRREIRQ